MKYVDYSDVACVIGKHATAIGLYEFCCGISYHSAVNIFFCIGIQSNEKLFRVLHFVF